MIKGIKKLGISLVIVIFSGMGLYWYSNIEAHPKSVVSSETDTKTEVIVEESKVAVDEPQISKNDSEDIKKQDETVNINNENLNESNKENKNLNEVNNQNLKKEFTVEDAKNLLIQYNSNVDYIYQGDETMFKDVLQDKGYKGYLFLPNVDGDIGFFVDKYNGDIYKFHPSGYMEKI